MLKGEKQEKGPQCVLHQVLFSSSSFRVLGVPGLHNGHFDFLVR